MPIAASLPPPDKPDAIDALRDAAGKVRAKPEAFAAAMGTLRGRLLRPPGLGGELVHAFMRAARAPGAGEEPWHVVRRLALRLQEQQGLDAAALALVRVLRLVARWGGRRTSRPGPGFLARLRADERALLRTVTARRYHALMEAGATRHAMDALHRLIRLTDDPAEAERLRETLRSIRTAWRRPLLRFAGILGLVAAVLIALALVLPDDPDRVREHRGGTLRRIDVPSAGVR